MSVLFLLSVTSISIPILGASGHMPRFMLPISLFFENLLFHIKCIGQAYLYALSNCIGVQRRKE